MINSEHDGIPISTEEQAEEQADNQVVLSPTLEGWFQFIRAEIPLFRRCPRFAEQIYRDGYLPQHNGNGTNGLSQAAVEEVGTDWHDVDVEITICPGPNLTISAHWVFGPPGEETARGHSIHCLVMIAGWEGVIDLPQLEATMRRIFAIAPTQNIIVEPPCLAPSLLNR